MFVRWRLWSANEHRWAVEPRRLWFDVGLATVVPTVQLAILGGRGTFVPWSGAALLTVALVLVQGLPLAARRYRPWLVFGVVLAANTVYYATALPPSGYDLGLAIALFTMANLRPVRASLLAYGLIVAETLVMKLAGGRSVLGPRPRGSWSPTCGSTSGRRGCSGGTCGCGASGPLRC